MLDSSGGAQVLKLANLNTVEHGEPVQRFRVYFARSLPDESAMVVVQAAFRDGYINLKTAVHRCVPRPAEMSTRSPRVVRPHPLGEARRSCGAQ